MGSLTFDDGPVAITDAGSTTQVSYFDNVSLTTQNGTMSETYKMPCTGAGGPGNYLTISYLPSGLTPNSASNPAVCSPGAPTAGMTFDRRWVIEQDKPVVGLRRITVLVMLDNRSVQLYTGTVLPGQQPPTTVTFQMSLVRP